MVDRMVSLGDFAPPATNLAVRTPFYLPCLQGIVEPIPDQLIETAEVEQVRRVFDGSPAYDNSAKLEQPLRILMP